MSSDLEALRITSEEIERLNGLDVSALFVGGVLGGVYRPSALKRPQGLFALILTEFLIALIVFGFSTLITIFLMSSASAGIKGSAEIVKFLAIAISLTTIAIASWNVYMKVLLKRMKPLMRLLDYVDRYNEMLHAIEVIDRLDQVQRGTQLLDRSQTIEALRMTRDTLVSGLLTEKILRENQGLFSRRVDLLSNIEQNLTAIQTLDINTTATEYAEFVSEALQIGISVHHEMQQFSDRS